MAALPSTTLARALIAENSYLTLATVDAAGRPWATPVWFAARDLDVFVWASKPGARHSLNLAQNAQVSLVVFDSSRAPGEGSALYVSATAALAGREEFDGLLDLYHARSRERGWSGGDADAPREPARHRLYRAVATEAFVLDDHDERIRVS